MTESGELRTLIGAVRRRWRTLAALRTIALASALAAVPLVLGAFAAWAFRPHGAALVALGVGALVSAVGVWALIARRTAPRPSDASTARFIEERAAELRLADLDDTLVTAVQVAADPRFADDGFAGALVSRAVRQMRPIAADAVVPAAALRRTGVQAAGGVLCLAAAVVLAMPMLGAAADAAWLAFFPHSIRISVEPGSARVAAGQPLQIRAVLTGRGSTLQGVAPSLVVAAGGEARTVPMTRDGDAYRFGFESVDRSFTYKVAAGAVTSDEYSVTALFPPRVRRIDVHYEYPSFSSLAPRTDEGAGDIYGPAGTRIRISVHADKPLANGELALAGTAALPLRLSGERTAEASLTLAADGAYRVKLADRDGLRSSGDTEYFIRIMEDRPPEIRLLRPSADQSITPLEEVSIEARADDDYGIARFELVYSVAGREARSVPFANVTGTNVSKVGAYLLPAEELGVQPGDVVTYYARAVDVGRGKRPTEARSDIFFLEVKPFGEEFVAAQSQAMGGGGAAAQLEGLIAAQKEIINATWNLERRAGAGRSAEDAKAVAQAQAELKARIERLTSGPRRFQNPFLPQQIAPQPRRGRAGADPIAAAVAAMSRAVEQLEGQRMREALPHEMAALQGLLQAQAEIRRRQVQQQSASGAAQGGTSRVGQDLSALFDRELQRQQRTNYESRSQIDERAEERRDDGALDRIRDLARRQEDLSRRQRELADASLSAEEMKRRLETLSREQEELRAQAEALERQMRESADRQTSASSGRGSSGAQTAPGSSMRGASEQMRQAAGDLKRQDARSAAERAREAAERLRRAEQQMSSGTAEARERTAGELQLEAQQLAEAQRRIASEAGRQQSGAPGTTADAMRRLSGEKEKLAERVESLARAARQLGSQGDRADQGGAARAREAAAVLDREQVARRMRDSARRMRDAAQGKPADGAAGARAEQEIARAMDRAAAALGGRSDDAALAQQLDETRAMRDRLNTLEQQVRDAEARARGEKPGARQPGADGRQGRQGARGSSGSGQPGEIDRLREEYRRELERTRAALARLQAGEQRSGYNMSTPETHEFSRSAPGTEAFKQDYSGWESLRRDVDLAMEGYEASLSRRASRESAGRLDAGGSERVPDAYRQSIARYYRSLATPKK